MNILKLYSLMMIHAAVYTRRILHVVKTNVALRPSPRGHRRLQISRRKLLCLVACDWSVEWDLANPSKDSAPVELKDAARDKSTGTPTPRHVRRIVKDAGASESRHEQYQS